MAAEAERFGHELLSLLVNSAQKPKYSRPRLGDPSGARLWPSNLSAIHEKYNRPTLLVRLIIFAEAERFELSVGCPTQTFQVCALDRYATPPIEIMYTAEKILTHAYKQNRAPHEGARHSD